MAPTMYHPNAFERGSKFHPVVRTTDQERELTDRRAAQHFQEASEAGYFQMDDAAATFARVREMFRVAIWRNLHHGRRVAGTYCDWCQTDFISVDELDSYFDWVRNIRGQSDELRVFCNDCAHRALVEEKECKP